MESILNKLNWRYATKQFDSSKKVSLEAMHTLLDAARMTASSYGLQPYQFFVVTDQNVKDKLKTASWGQSQLTDASHILVLANQSTFDEALVDNYIHNLVGIRGIDKKDVADYSQLIKSSLMGLSDEQKNEWTTKQAYIVLGNLLTIAAEMEIDTCPMEGFDNEKYNEILGLKDKNLNAAVVLAIGYRSTEDKTQHYPKVRYTKESLTTHI